jgi:imidazolonepropionase-like amidohydrolase
MTDHRAKADLMVTGGPRTVLRIATMSAAKVLGWDDEIGSLEAGKRADVTVIRWDDARWAVYPDPLVGLCRTA